ncbi:MAG: DUF928 domain-containing protein [Stenomitos frigidus ULC029]
MNKLTLSLQQASLACVLTFALSALPSPLRASVPIPSSASNKLEKAVASKGQKVRFTRPSLPRRGAPTGRIWGGGSRGTCPPVAQPLTALVPVYELNSEGIRPSWALTVSDRPTFWFYVPYTLTQDLPVEFVLEDSQRKDIHKTSLTQNGASPGIVRVQWPATAPPLKSGEQYRWYFLIQCNSIATHVEGVVERLPLPPDLQRQLQGKGLKEQAEIYAANGIWYDALTTLAEFRRSKLGNTDALANWQSFLQSAGLEAITVDAPITNCCTPTKGSQK